MKYPVFQRKTNFPLNVRNNLKNISDFHTVRCIENNFEKKFFIVTVKFKTQKLYRKLDFLNCKNFKAFF